eukprot:TRINITY_DN10868_c0_g1_i1.p1 TRINITY_DN10868_c0_g1~~TRINITY_DN10868_c0_g1_i1.p1  ORF type:complete len:236 (+),score=29.54 TRINITY_DN10868_c0_g1_i1:40-747(+)
MLAVIVLSLLPLAARQERNQRSYSGILALDMCDHVVCEKGTFCRVSRTGLVVCVKDNEEIEEHDVCKDALCPRGTHCVEEVTGHTWDLCNTSQSNASQCYPYPAYARQIVYYPEAVCRKPSSCRKIACSPGSVCIKKLIAYDNTAFCTHRCNNFFCFNKYCSAAANPFVPEAVCEEIVRRVPTYSGSSEDVFFSVPSFYFVSAWVALTCCALLLLWISCCLRCPEEHFKLPPLDV